jgi:hypothetical protein
LFRGDRTLGLTNQCGQGFKNSREGIKCGGPRIYSSNLRSNLSGTVLIMALGYVECIFEVIEGLVDGIVTVFKFLVAGASHWGDKLERIGLVAPHKKWIMREWYHYDQCKKRNLMRWVPNKGVGEGGWVHIKKVL